jgi:hypothetical protein
MSLMTHALVRSLFPLEIALKFAFSLPSFTRNSSQQANVPPTFRVGNRWLDLDHGRVRTIIDSRVMHGINLNRADLNGAVTSGAKHMHARQERHGSTFPIGN